MYYASHNVDVKDITSKLFWFVKNKLVFASCGMNANQSGVDYSDAARGLSIKMIPLTPVPHSVLYPSQNIIVDTPYENFQLSKDSQWDEFLGWVSKIYYQPTLAQSPQNN